MCRYSHWKVILTVGFAFSTLTCRGENEVHYIIINDKTCAMQVPGGYAALTTGNVVSIFIPNDVIVEHSVDTQLAKAVGPSCGVIGMHGPSGALIGKEDTIVKWWNRLPKKPSFVILNMCKGGEFGVDPTSDLNGIGYHDRFIAAQRLSRLLNVPIIAFKTDISSRYSSLEGLQCRRMTDFILITEAGHSIQSPTELCQIFYPTRDCKPTHFDRLLTGVRLTIEEHSVPTVVNNKLIIHPSGLKPTPGAPLPYSFSGSSWRYHALQFRRLCGSYCKSAGKMGLDFVTGVPNSVENFWPLWIYALSYMQVYGPGMLSFAGGPVFLPMMVGGLGILLQLELFDIGQESAAYWSFNLHKLYEKLIRLNGEGHDVPVAHTLIHHSWHNMVTSRLMDSLPQRPSGLMPSTLSIGQLNVILRLDEAKEYNKIRLLSAGVTGSMECPQCDPQMIQLMNSSDERAANYVFEELRKYLVRRNCGGLCRPVGIPPTSGSPGSGSQGGSGASSGGGSDYNATPIGCTSGGHIRRPVPTPIECPNNDVSTPNYEYTPNQNHGPEEIDAF